MILELEALGAKICMEAFLHSFEENDWNLLGYFSARLRFVDTLSEIEEIVQFAKVFSP